jgi:hypothetical protein
MFALKTLGLFETSSVSQSTWGELIRDRIGTSGKAEEKLRKHLVKSNVADVDSAIEAIKWLQLLDNTPLGQSDSSSFLKCHPPSIGTNIPIDALSNLLEGKLKFSDTEKDMVAMFHAITGKMPDGSFERHESRLLGFGKPGGDTSMAETVGYTAGLPSPFSLPSLLIISSLCSCCS